MKFIRVINKRERYFLYHKNVLIKLRLSFLSSLGPPDYKGSRFVTAKASFLYISTMKSSVLFKLPCKNIDKPETLITSAGKTFELDIPIQLRAERQTNQDMPDIDRSTNGDKPYIGGSTRIDYDGIALEAIDDIIVFGVKLNYKPTLFMPSDVMGTDYFIISPGQGEIVIMDTKYGNSRITVNITFPECLGNCSLPVCATQNITRHLSGCQTRIVFTCQTDLSGVKDTSNSPITVTVDDPSNAQYKIMGKTIYALCITK